MTFIVLIWNWHIEKKYAPNHIASKQRSLDLTLGCLTPEFCQSRGGLKFYSGGFLRGWPKQQRLVHPCCWVCVLSQWNIQTEEGCCHSVCKTVWCREECTEAQVRKLEIQFQCSHFVALWHWINNLLMTLFESWSADHKGVLRVKGSHHYCRRLWALSPKTETQGMFWFFLSRSAVWQLPREGSSNTVLERGDPSAPPWLACVASTHL